MRMRARPLLLCLLLAGLTTSASAAFAAAPAVGEPAPPFRFEGEGGSYELSDYVGPQARKRGVVVAWFPKAFTPG